MRIVAGAWRGRTLTTPSGNETRPTADRVRQALFDVILHAPWAGRPFLEGASVLDAFAGTGALGLEALSRGADRAVFVERSPAALAVLRANIAVCRAVDRCTVLPVDALAIPAGKRVDLVFLDPPYDENLIDRTLTHLRSVGRVGPGTLIVTETRRDEPAPDVDILSERTHGIARITIWREE